MLVRDALTMGPRHGEDGVTPHTRPPADEDGEHLLVRTVLCLGGEVEIELVCEPAFDYGRAPAEWSMPGENRGTADASGAGVTGVRGMSRAFRGTASPPSSAPGTASSLGWPFAVLSLFRL